MKKARFLGTISAMTGAATYGTNPLFAMFMILAGIGVNSILFYRYLLATIIFFVWLKFFKKISLKINKEECFSLALSGLLFSLSSITLFDSYRYIGVGIASTILFVYPIMVAILMTLFFKEKITKPTIVAIILTTIGTALLYKGDANETLNIKGVILVLFSALMYALYMVGIKKNSTIKRMNTDKLTFYVIFFGLFVYIFNLKFCTQLQIINTPLLIGCAIGLAILPTILSIEMTNLGIKLIGSTKTAIFGALEPITALIFGVALFHEHLSVRICFGILLIILAVSIVVLNNSKKSK